MKCYATIWIIFYIKSIHVWYNDHTPVEISPPDVKNGQFGNIKADAVDMSEISSVNVY